MREVLAGLDSADEDSSYRWPLYNVRRHLRRTPHTSTTIEEWCTLPGAEPLARPPIWQRRPIAAGEHTRRWTRTSGDDATHSHPSPTADSGARRVLVRRGTVRQRPVPLPADTSPSERQTWIKRHVVAL